MNELKLATVDLLLGQEWNAKAAEMKRKADQAIIDREKIELSGLIVTYPKRSIKSSEK
jgi:hypothetical protein